MGVFELFNKKKPKIEVPELGEFTLITDRSESRIEGNYNSTVFGLIKLSFPVVSHQLSQYQIDMLRQLERNWPTLSENLDPNFNVTSILIPPQNSHEYNAIDAEIVVQSEEHIKSLIIKNGTLDEVIEIE